MQSEPLGDFFGNIFRNDGNGRVVTIVFNVNNTKQNSAIRSSMNETCKTMLTVAFNVAK